MECDEIRSAIISDVTDAASLKVSFGKAQAEVEFARPGANMQMVANNDDIYQMLIYKYLNYDSFCKNQDIVLDIPTDKSVNLVSG